MPGWRNGRRNGLKIRRFIHTGSSPVPGTILFIFFLKIQNDVELRFLSGILFVFCETFFCRVIIFFVLQIFTSILYPRSYRQSIMQKPDARRKNFLRKGFFLLQFSLFQSCRVALIQLVGQLDQYMLKRFGTKTGQMPAVVGY